MRVRRSRVVPESTDPSWKTRVWALASLVREFGPQTPASLEELAEKCLGWTAPFTRNTLVAGDPLWFIYREGTWDLTAWMKDRRH